MVPKSNSIEIFFLLVRAGLFGRTEGIEYFLPDDVDWEEVYRLTKEQSVMGLVAEGIEIYQNEWLKTHDSALVPRQWTKQIASNTLRMEQRNLDMNHFVA